MRRILAICLLLAIALPCQAQGDKPKPNTLTPKEIADGWILLFDGETTFGWKEVVGKVPKKYHAENQALVVDAGSITHDVQFSEYELTFEYQSNGDGGRFSWR